MDILLYIIGGLLFIISTTAYIYVKFRLRPKDPDLDNYYYEFEDTHPEVIRYTKWTRLTFTAVIMSMLLLLLAYII